MDKQLEKLEKVISLIDTDYVTAEDFAASLVVLIEQLKKLEEEGDEKLENLNIDITRQIAQIKAFLAKKEESSTKDKTIRTEEIKGLKNDLRDAVADLKERIYGIKLRKGEDGKDGKIGPMGPAGKDGSPDEPKDIKKKLESLKGDERLDAKAIKNLPNATREIIREVGMAHAGAMETPVKDASTGLLFPKDASGAWLITAGSGSSILLETNGTPNGSQTLLNLVAGSNVTLVDNGTGSVTISAAFSGGGDFLIGQTSGLISNPTPVGPGTETFLGQDAGAGGSTDDTVFIGQNAGLNASNAILSNFIGFNAGNGSTDAQQSQFFGIMAGQNAGNADHSTFIGSHAGENANTSPYSVFIGNEAGLSSTSADHSVFLGTSAGAGAITANNSIFIGNNAGIADTLNNSGNDTASILIGNYINTGGFQNSILLGSGLSFAAQSNTAANQFMLADSILYARWRGIDYTFPATQAVGPTDALLNDGFGNLYWSPTGTVSSVDVSGTGALSFTGGPITTSGTIFASFTGSTSEYIRGDGSLATFPSALVLQTNGTPNGSQALLNIAAGTDITLTDNGSGTVTIDSTASSPITIQNTSSLFSTGLSGTGSASTSTEAIYLGTRAGFQATSSDESVFIGHQSGEDASNAPQSVFLGFNVGNAAINADHSFFVGRDAGKNATNADSSQFIGYQAGNGATNANNSTFIGFNSGSGAANANNSIFIGDNAGQSDTVNNSSSGTSILIGDNSSTGGFSNSIAIGKSALNTKVNQFVIGSSYINFRARGIDYEWPSAQAAGSGYVLTNNGSGVLSWTLGGGGTTIYTGDDSLTGSRRVELAGNDLNFGDTASGDTVGLFLDTGGLISSLGSPHSSGDTNIHVNNTLNKVRVEGGFLEVVTSAIDTGFLMTGNINSFFQGNMQNTNSGASASTDWVVTADNGTATTHYADFGINSSGGGGAPFTTANHAYLYSIDDTLNIGALGASSQIRFFTTGGTSPVQRMVIDNAGLVGINQTTPTSFLHITRNAIGVTQSDAYGIFLENATPATAGATVQVSPGIVFGGAGYSSGAGATRSIKFRMDVLPTTGGTALGGMRIQSSFGGGAYATLFATLYNSSGDGVIQLSGANVISFGSATTSFYSGSVGFSFLNSAGSTTLGTISNVGAWALTPSALTGSSAITAWNLAQTWNTSGTPTAHNINITVTAANAASLLSNQQVGGVSRFSVGIGGSPTSGTIAITTIQNNFAPTSGTAVFNTEVISPTINQTGGANGITRGLYINPTITAAADFRALEISAGNAVFGGSIIASGATSVVRLKGYTVATLPAGTIGDTAYVTDALAPAFLVAVAGGGAVVTTVFYNGAAWVAQ